MRPYFNFQGRLTRRAFWLGSAVVWGGFVALFVLLEAGLGRPSTLLLYPPFFWSLFALMTRRLHDRGRSGGFLVLLLVPLLGPLWIGIELTLLRGSRGDNRYGPDPLAAGHLTVA